MVRVGITENVTPALKAWLEGTAPAAGRALLKSARLIRTQALQNIRSTFKRTGRNRTGGGMRGLRLKSDQSAGIRTVRLWHGSGLLAAHELGSAVPGATIRPRRVRVLRWTNRDGTVGYARQITRSGFTLKRRPTLVPAYTAMADKIVPLLEAEYQALLDKAPESLRSVT
jgi:hypothetical protein